MKNVHLLVGCATAIILSSCGQRESHHPTYDLTDQCLEKNYSFDSIPILDLPLEKRAYISTDTVFFLPTISDADGIVLFDFEGTHTYHPVIMAQYSLKLLEIYRKTKDSSCLKVVKKHADKFIGLSYQVDTAMLFPYSFDCYFNDRDTMKAPWYSGMAQGQVLSVFSRLYELTGEQHYLSTARRIYNSFYLMKGQHAPWISCIDNQNNFWIEEYPHKIPSHVLNGKIFAIYGLYDYYQITKSDEVLKILTASISTIKRKMYEYRNENLISYYCLKYNVRNYGYQDIHIAQFYQLEKMTGIEEFKILAQNMREDQKNAPPKP